MRAAVVKAPGPAESIEVIDVPDPRPGPGELSIDVEFAGVGFVDTLFRAGAFPLPVPFVPGIEATGRVREVGSDVTGFEPGQPVGALLNDFGRGPRAGGYAEIAVAHASMAVRLPADASLERFAGVLVNGVTAWMALNDLARLDVADDVLVLGASGGLGGTSSRVAALHPARRVIGVVGSEAKRAAGAAECTDVILAADLPAAIDELTGGRGVDVVIDPVGGTPRSRAFDALAPFGRLLVLGNASGEDPALSGDAALSAVALFTDRGLLREPGPVVVSLQDVAEVHRALENRTAPPKTVLAIRV